MKGANGLPATKLAPCIACDFYRSHAARQPAPRQGCITETHKNNPMQTLKNEALQAIASLPDNVDMEEIMYRLYVLENIRQGRQDVEAGKTTPAEEVLREIESW